VTQGYLREASELLKLFDLKCLIDVNRASQKLEKSEILILCLKASSDQSHCMAHYEWEHDHKYNSEETFFTIFSLILNLLVLKL
jgi:hypothetical protein